MRLLYLAALGGALLLAGCAGPGDYRPPVVERTPQIEDRTIPPSAEEVMPSEPAQVAEDDLPLTRPGLPEVDKAEPVEKTDKVDKVDSRIYRPDATTARRSSAPVLALLSQAQQAGAAGRYPQALASLERAQRIAPRDPAVYEAMARLKIDLGEYAQAEQLGLKGLELGPAADLRLKLEAVVAEARRRK